MKKTLAGLAAAVVALGSLGAQAQTAGSTGSDTMGTHDQTMNKGTKKTDTMKTGDTTAQVDSSSVPVAGVVTNIDKKANTLTIVAPAGGEVDITKYGQSLVTDQQMNLISLKAPLNQGALLMRDGKSAKIADIKEGDVVRTNFDPNAMSFTGLVAVSQKQVDKDIKGAQKELKRDMKSLEKAGKTMNE